MPFTHSNLTHSSCLELSAWFSLSLKEVIGVTLSWLASKFLSLLFVWALTCESVPHELIVTKCEGIILVAYKYGTSFSAWMGGRTWVSGWAGFQAFLLSREVCRWHSQFYPDRAMISWGECQCVFLWARGGEKELQRNRCFVLECHAICLRGSVITGVCLSGGSAHLVSLNTVCVPRRGGCTKTNTC